MLYIQGDHKLPKFVALQKGVQGVARPQNSMLYNDFIENTLNEVEQAPVAEKSS